MAAYPGYFGFCTMGGSGDPLAIFIYVNGLQHADIWQICELQTHSNKTLETITKAISIHPEGNMTVCRAVHPIAVFRQNPNENLLMALEYSESPK